jgi:glycosyltransferase involved in cell wall biosynthesis
MKGPKVSVVMPVYNGERFLREAMDSIISQSYENWEFLIIDDGSIDGTRAILEDYDDSRIKIIRNDKRGGLTKALNKAIRIASGEYIARQDADDVSLPCRFEMQINFLEKHPDYGIVGSSYFQIDEKGKILSQINVFSEDTQIRESLMAQNWFGHGSVMMRKDVLKYVDGYDDRFEFAQDYDLWLRIIEVFKVANISKPLYCWRFTNSSISKRNQQEQRKYASLALFKAIRRKYLIEGSNKPSPLVSVIVPTYNRSEKLVEAISSVTNQEYCNYEIIVVNDGGVDVQDIITRLNTKENISYFRHKYNKGVAAARNTGLRLSKGKYIAYLNDNDIFYPNHLEILAKYLEVSDYKVAYTNAYRAVEKDVDERYVISHRDIPCSFEFNKNQILIKNFIPVLCVMHEKSCIDEIGYFDERLKSHEDWDLWIRMSMKYEFACINAFTCEYRCKEDDNMANEMKEHSLWAMQTIYKKYEEKIKKKPELYSEQKKYFLKRLEEVYLQKPFAKGVEFLRNYNNKTEMVEVNCNEIQKVTEKRRKGEIITESNEIVNGNRYHALAKRDLGGLCYKNEDKWLTLARLAQYLSVEPEDIEAIKYYEIICFELGLTSRGISLLKEIIKKNPKDLKALLKQGFLLVCYRHKSELVNMVMNRLYYEINNIIQRKKIAKCLKELSATIKVHL